MLRFAIIPETLSLQPYSLHFRRTCPFVMACVMAFLTGCEQSAPIVTYTVPTKLPNELLPSKDRMLAAMVPKGQDIWFFKVTGPEGAVGLIEAPFRGFVEDIEFANGAPVLVDLPEGWRRGGEKPLRYATLDVDTADKQLGISVSKLQRREDSSWDRQVEDNVNRWRGQLGLAKSEQKWAEAEPLSVKAADPDAIWVDLVGGFDGSPPMAAPFANRVPPPAPSPNKPDSPSPQAAKSADRMLAAMVPKGEDVWFFKVTGSKGSVASVETPFRNFVESIEFDKGVPVLTDLPKGWTRGGAGSFRYATLNVETPTGKLDVSVSKLVRQPERPWQEQVEMNVNRWRGQMGLANSEQELAGGQPLSVQAADSGSVWVDLVAKASSATLPPATVSPGVEEPKDGVTFERPEGWRDGKMSSMRLAAFNVGPEDAPAEITVIPAGGELRGNIARWLGQIRDGVVPDEVIDQALKDAKEVTVAGIAGKRFVLTGEDPNQGKAIDATIVPLGPDGNMSLFVKMTGPAETVAKQSDAIASFLRSLKLNL